MSEHEDEWAEYAGDWDDDEGARIYSRSAHAHLLETLAQRGPDLSGATICDFGCGTGLLTERLADDAHRIDAVDTSPAMLDQLTVKIAERGWTNVTASNAIPATTGRHDLVVASSVLSFVEDLPDTVRRLAALLRPGGALVHWDWERLDDDDHGLTRADVTTALEAAGLEHVHVDAAFRFQVEGQLVWPIVGAGWRPR